MSEERARKHFEEATAQHEMTVLHEDGLYRHLRFQAPDTWVYGYDLVTWPGHLAINGDIGSGYTFARLEDMVNFFASGPGINPSYWAEKITCRQIAVRVYSREVLAQRVASAFSNLQAAGYSAEQEAAIRAAWHDEAQWMDLDHEYPAQTALMDFGPVEGFTFGDAWEWSLREWDYSYLISCHAIRAGVERYRKERSNGNH